MSKKILEKRSISLYTAVTELFFKSTQTVEVLMGVRCDETGELPVIPERVTKQPVALVAGFVPVVITACELVRILGLKTILLVLLLLMFDEIPFGTVTLLMFVGVARLIGNHQVHLENVFNQESR